jgi:hypothetical protein
LREVQSRSSARPIPTSRGTIQLVPCSATRPRLLKIDVKLDALEAKRTSHIAASTTPPPAATPFTAAITGLGTSSRYEKSPGISGAVVPADSSARGLRPWVVCASTSASSPEQKPRPLPVITMPTTAGSATASSTARRIAASIG